MITPGIFIIFVQ